MFINSNLLSEPKLYSYLCEVLKKELYKTEEINFENIKKIAYSSWHQRHYKHIDQVFHQHWDHLLERMEQEKSLSIALLSQVVRYHFNEDPRYLAIRINRFGEWQNWLSNQSGLPAIALKITSMHCQNKNSFEIKSWLKSLLGYRALVSPFHPFVEDYIEINGLNESHMHLNNTTSLESLWHFSLNNPDAIIQDIEDEYHKPRVQLLYSNNDIFNSPEHYRELLYLAKKLRYLLLSWTDDIENIEAQVEDIQLFLNDNYFQLFNEKQNKITNHIPSSTNNDKFFTHINEIELHIYVINKLKNEKNIFFDICYLTYILCMNCFQRLLVQRDDQYGFEQFQKFADDGIRETYEKEYTARFYQLHGPKAHGRPDLLTLEGRFAPKAKQQKNEDLIRSILNGFISYANGDSGKNNPEDLNKLADLAYEYHRPTLRLVAHFIKQPWDYKSDYHFLNLRNSLDEKGKLLFQLLDNYPSLRKIITGIDAAANEQETPPEVFSSLYRQCRYHNIRNFTYHVGEDFEHLLSGIRAIYEAILFLELRHGDRIGHATAIGINPTYWLDNMPDFIFLSKGQWLENLLFLREISLCDPEIHLSLSHLEAEINELSLDIFKENIELNILQQYFKLRGLSPKIIKLLTGDDETIKKLALSEFENNEHMDVKNIAPSVINILKSRWFNKEVIDNYDEKKEFSVKSIRYDILVKSQQFVQKIISQKQIIIETLPTSNVRISHYNSIKQHHIFRWIQVPERIIKGDIPMLVSLGSDDPGIFVTDMRNEFYHIFCTLITEFGYSEDRALNEVIKINENGRIFRFDGPTYTTNIKNRPLAEKGI